MLPSADQHHRYPTPLRRIRHYLGAEVRFATEEMMPYAGPVCEEIG